MHRLLDDKEDAFGLYGMIIRQFRLLLLAKEYLATGGNPGGIAEAHWGAQFRGTKTGEADARLFPGAA